MVPLPLPANSFWRGDVLLTADAPSQDNLDVTQDRSGDAFCADICLITLLRAHSC
jgi:hypothetical protein